MKKEWIIAIIIFVLLVLGAIYLINKNYFGGQIPAEEIECQTDADCVASSCCHATECVSKDKAPECGGIYCTMDCAPNTLDCGYANCLCFKNKCKTSLK